MGLECLPTLGWLELVGGACWREQCRHIFHTWSVWEWLRTSCKGIDVSPGCAAFIVLDQFHQHVDASKLVNMVFKLFTVSSEISFLIAHQYFLGLGQLPLPGDPSSAQSGIDSKTTRQNADVLVFSSFTRPHNGHTTVTTGATPPKKTASHAASHAREAGSARIVRDPGPSSIQAHVEKTTWQVTRPLVTFS